MHGILGICPVYQRHPESAPKMLLPDALLIGWHLRTRIEDKLVTPKPNPRIPFELSIATTFPKANSVF